MNNLNSSQNKKACKSYDLQAFAAIWILSSGDNGITIEHLIPVLMFIDSLDK